MASLLIFVCHCFPYVAGYVATCQICKIRTNSQLALFIRYSYVSNFLSSRISYVVNVNKAIDVTKFQHYHHNSVVCSQLVSQLATVKHYDQITQCGNTVELYTVYWESSTEENFRESCKSVIIHECFLPLIFLLDFRN